MKTSRLSDDLIKDERSWWGVGAKNKRVKGTTLLAEKLAGREKESGFFVSNYFPALFAEEDIGYKKETRRSGDSCFAIKSDLNSKTLPAIVERESTPSPFLPPSHSLSISHPLPFASSCSSCSSPRRRAIPLLMITRGQSVKPRVRVYASSCLQISELLNEP